MTHLPEEISLLTQMCQLGLGRNQLSKLPDISRLQQLRILTAYDNALTTLDESLGRLIAVEKLDFSANSITDVPWSVFQLPALTYLNLRRNKLCQIQSPPLDSLLESRKNRSEMVIVDLSWNELQSIPYRFTLMANWQLRLNKNPFNRPISEFKIFSVPVSLKLLALRSIYRRHFKKNRIAIDKGKLETWVKLYRLPFRLHEELLRYDYCEICWAPVQTDYLISKVVPYSCGAESGRCNTLQCIICNNRKALLAKFGL
jgi:hypothetical protein